MKIKLGKKFPCEVEVFNGDKLIDKYISLENDLVTKNPLGHRPIENIEFEDKKVETIKYKT
jgi:hypothetical protein